MADKEGGDSEKKMTKDFLDRWKKIASKYEGPEGEGEAPKEGEKAPKKADEELDRVLADIAEKGEAGEPKREPKKADEDELDAMVADFGFKEDDEGRLKAAVPSAPRDKPKAAPVRAAPAAPAAAPRPAAQAPEDAQKRVLDTLKKVGLVKPSAEEALLPAPKAPEPALEEEAEDTLMVELESLLADDGTKPEQAEAKGGQPKSRAALEEEDLIAELEGLLEGAGEEEHEAPLPKPVPAVVPPKKPAEPQRPAARAPPVAAPAKVEAVQVERPVRATPAAIQPPAARPVLAAEKAEVRISRTNGGRVNGGRVNGGRVNGGRVNGGRVNGGRVNGGRVNGGRVNGGRVNGGRVNGGRVNGGRVNGGRVNGGRMNGGRVNGGRVNGGRVNGGRVNGGRVNGGRVNGGRGLPPLLRAQNRRQTIVSLAVAAAVVVSLVLITPFGAQPRGPAVDGDLADWDGTGAIRFSDAQDGSIPAALDLREYAVRVDNGRLWFEAQTAGNLFTRPGTGAFPARADDILVLIDVDGSPTTGYSYAGLGVERLIEVYGWDGALKSKATRAWTGRASYDFAGFEAAAGLEVAVKDNRIEGTLTGLAPSSGSTLANARAIFELRGLDATVERLDASAAPATVSAPSVSVTATPLAPGVVAAGSAGNAALLGLALSNPSHLEVRLASVRVTATYAPAAPADLATATLYRDLNENMVVDGPDQALLSAASALPQGAPTVLTLSQPLVLTPQAQASLLVVVEHAPANAPNGTSLGLTVSGPSDFAVDQGALVTLREAPVLAGRHPVAYIGGPPSAMTVDGNTLEWAAAPEALDPPADVSDGHIDITSLKGNATATQASFLVSFVSTPLAGAVLPFKLPSSSVVPSTPGGGGGTPAVPQPNTGADVLWLMVDGDNDTLTGLFTGGHGYDFAVRVDGKNGRPLPDGARLFRWDTLPTPAWTLLPQVPPVGFGASALEVGAPLPPLNLTARNVTVTAYATNWQGARDDLSTPYVLSNDLGTRAQSLPTGPSGAEGGDEPVLPPVQPIPEFGEVALPVTLALMGTLVIRRRRARRAGES